MNTWVPGDPIYPAPTGSFQCRHCGAEWVSTEVHVCPQCERPLATHVSVSATVGWPGLRPTTYELGTGQLDMYAGAALALRQVPELLREIADAWDMQLKEGL